jgi:hypothetical protein
MEELAELMQRLLEIQSGGRPKSPKLVAEDERLMDRLQEKCLAGKAPEPLETDLCTRLKALGFTRGKQVNLYGEVFDLDSEPIVMANNSVFVDATEKKSGQSRRVCIPRSIVNMCTAA